MAGYRVGMEIGQKGDGPERRRVRKETARQGDGPAGRLYGDADCFWLKNQATRSCSGGVGKSPIGGGVGMGPPERGPGAERGAMGLSPVP